METAAFIKSHDTCGQVVPGRKYTCGKDQEICDPSCENCRKVKTGECFEENGKQIRIDCLTKTEEPPENSGAGTLETWKLEWLLFCIFVSVGCL